MIPARILGTGSVLPGPAVTTEEVARAAGKDPATVLEKTGIVTRHWAPRGSRMAEVGAEALRLALDQAGMAASDLRRLVFVSSTGGDYLIPATANAVANLLGVADTCDCFDLNNACVGFLTALDLAARCAATGLAPTGIVVVDFMSHFTRPDDPRPYLIFGDAAAAAIVGRDASGEAGILGVKLANRAAFEGAATLLHPRLRGELETIQFGIANRLMSDGAAELIAGAAREALAEAQCTVDDIDWVVPHQPNGRMLDAILAALDVPPPKMVRVVERVGSLGAASVPLGLDRLRRDRPVQPGDRVLMVGVGGGVSYGALVVRL